VKTTPKIAAALAAVALLTGACGNDDSPPNERAAITTTTDTTEPPTTQPTTTGHDIFIANCARCHGQQAEGGLGPQLAGGGALRAFPNLADQIEFVEGHTLPPFREQLTDEEIQAVVDYTRSLD
jgi:mono/diheme cytochrome c family protein